MGEVIAFLSGAMVGVVLACVIQINRRENNNRNISDHDLHKKSDDI